MDMIESSIKSCHVYKEATAEVVVSEILNTYFDCYVAFKKIIEKHRTPIKK